jgi:hypothetical protein
MLLHILYVLLVNFLFVYKFIHITLHINPSRPARGQRYTYAYTSGFVRSARTQYYILYTINLVLKKRHLY